MTGIAARVRLGSAVALGWMTATAVLLATSIGALRARQGCVAGSSVLDPVLVPHRFQPGHADLEESTLFSSYNCSITLSILA